MDNRQINIISDKDAHLRAALEIAFAGAAGGKVSHYRVAKLKYHTTYWNKDKDAIRHDTVLMEPANNTGTETLILYWHKEKDNIPLPYAMEINATYSFVKGWLDSREVSGEPDHDGDNKKGFRVFNDQWGRVIDSYSFVGIQFEWAMYGK